MNMKDLVDKYLADRETAWAGSTLKSERSRLQAIKEHLDKAPEKIHEVLKRDGKKPYAIRTTFIRLCDFENWAFENGLAKQRVFRPYMEKHRNRFKHAYQKEDLNITFEEALTRIEALAEPYRTQAKEMLRTGVRVSECKTVRNGKVFGKGGKIRTVYGKLTLTAPRSTFWRKLKAVGLKPHTLRKLCATRLADNGATAADLCKVFGWTSIQTGYQYLQAKDDERLQALVETATKEPERANL